MSSLPQMRLPEWVDTSRVDLSKYDPETRANFQTLIDALDGKQGAAAPSNPLRRFTTKDLKDELIDRGCTDFSKLSMHFQLAPFYLFLALLIVMQIGKLSDGSLLACLLP
jgi:hypothetical protein